MDIFEKCAKVKFDIFFGKMIMQIDKILIPKQRLNLVYRHE